MSFGTLGGDIVLTDERMSRVASRFHVVEGPVLGLSLCGWDLVVTGGTERLSAAECGYLFQNAQNSQLTLSSLCHRTLSQRLRCVAAEHGWSTQLRAVDVRMMRHSAPSNALSPNGTATSSSIWDPDTCENTNPKSFFTALQQFKRSCSLNPEDKLQLVDIKKHPQLSHSVLSLASTGHILSIEVRSSCSLANVSLCLAKFDISFSRLAHLVYGLLSCTAFLNTSRTAYPLCLMCLLTGLHCRTALLFWTLRAIYSFQQHQRK